MDSVYQNLAERALKVRSDSKSDASCGRVIIALAGPPGSGKTTVAAEVVRRINAKADRQLAVVLPMDGFHFSRAYLDAMPNTAEAYARRGVYWTFDAEGVLALVKKLHASRSGKAEVILAPSFDHEQKDPVADALRIEPETEIVIVEGNWLLLDRDPWRNIAAHTDDTWFVDVESSLALRRVADRHIKAGIEKDWESAVARAEGNDLLNGDEVRNNLIKPNVVVQSVEEKMES